MDTVLGSPPPPSKGGSMLNLTFDVWLNGFCENIYITREDGKASLTSTETDDEGILILSLPVSL